MLRKLAWSLVLAFPLLAASGCGSPDVKVPENPTPPPAGDPVSTSASAQDTDR